MKHNPDLLLRLAFNFQADERINILWSLKDREPIGLRNNPSNFPSLICMLSHSSLMKFTRTYWLQGISWSQYLIQMQGFIRYHQRS